MDPSDIPNNNNNDYSAMNNPNYSTISDNSTVTSKSFSHVFIPISHEGQTSINLCQQIRTSIRNRCIPSKHCGKSYLKVLFPFLSWLKVYEISWLPTDILCGVTVAIMQIPQGMGYALLAHVPAITGLYASFFPSLIYALFGTSRHLSMGGIAVISLMTGNVVDRLNTKPTLSTMFSDGLNETSMYTILSKDVLTDSSYAITIASTLAFMVGCIQFILCIFHLGFVTAFLSDSFISGYTTGTAILVFTSQIPDIFGLSLKRNVGPFNVIKTYIDIIFNIKKTNMVTLMLSICSIISLVIVKEYIEPIYKKTIKTFKLFQTVQVPIPIELIVIIVGTLVSYFFDLNESYAVKTVNTIGRGFRKPQLPSLVLLPNLLKDAIMIAIISFAICISLAKTFAKKFKYSINSNQELAAYSACNIIGSFFSSYASAASLSRTSVYVNAGGRTQLASLISSAFLLVIILQVGVLLEPLPKACLASVIIVALKNLLLQAKEIYTIGRVSKLEAIVWAVTFLSTVVLDVDYGLFFGLITSLFIVILRQFQPQTAILGHCERHQIHNKSVKHRQCAEEIPQIKIFRFESPIVYFNADYFRESLLDTVGIDFNTVQKRRVHAATLHNHYFYLPKLTHVIIDCSSVSQFDYSGGRIFLQTIKDLNDCQYKVYLCHLRYYNYDMLEKLGIHKICSVTVTATIHDAIHQIQDEPIENNDQDNENHKSA